MQNLDYNAPSPANDWFGLPDRKLRHLNSSAWFRMGMPVPEEVLLPFEKNLHRVYDSLLQIPKGILTVATS